MQADYIRGYMAGYITKLANATTDQTPAGGQASKPGDSEDAPTISDRDKRLIDTAFHQGYLDGLNTSINYLGAAAGGALAGGGVGAAIAPSGQRGTYGLYGALGGAAIAPTALYLAQRIATSRTK